MNAACERVNGTLRRELPDRTLIPGERHHARVLREYMTHDNGDAGPVIGTHDLLAVAQRAGQGERPPLR